MTKNKVNSNPSTIAELSTNTMRTKAKMIPMIGVYGYRGVLKGRSNLGISLLSLIKDRFTRANTIKEMKPEA